MSTYQIPSRRKSFKISLSWSSFILCLSIVAFTTLLPSTTDPHKSIFVSALHPEPRSRKMKSHLPTSTFHPMFVFHRKRHRAQLVSSTLQDESSVGVKNSSIVGKDLLHRVQIASYFALWYALNVIFNIVNKRVLNVLPAPLIVGTLQLGIGGIYAALLWLCRLRPIPRLSQNKTLQRAIWNVGLYHSTGQLFSMISLGAGPVSFTHIVKALEPFFSALVSALLSQKWMPWQVYATLIPVVGGVGYACSNERSFSWLAFWTAMGSNLAFALRAVVSKSLMTARPTTVGTTTQQHDEVEETISSVNLFALVTWAAFFISIPIAILGEGSSYFQVWNEAIQQQLQRMIKQDPSVAASSILLRDAKINLIGAVVSSGLFHYLNNEVMYMALDNVHPVTLAVGNTMKRVFIIVASVLVFHNPVSLQAAIGSIVGIFGVLLYSLTKQHYEKLEMMQRNVKK